MTYPVDKTNASGYPPSGKLIPQLWSKMLNIEFYKETVLPYICNTNWHGEISKQGDEVKIHNAPTITTSDQEIAETLVYQNSLADVVELPTNKAKHFYFYDTCGVVRKQSDYDFVSHYFPATAEGLAVDVDKQVLQAVHDDAHADNKGDAVGAHTNGIDMGTTTAPVVLTKATIFEKIVDCWTVLSEQNVPKPNRWMLLPPEIAKLIQKSDLKDASISGDRMSNIIRRNDYLGTIAGFTLYESQNLSTGTANSKTYWNCLFGHTSAITFASQIAEFEGPIRAIDRFSSDFDLYRGLAVYGFKVVKPKALGLLLANT